MMSWIFQNKIRAKKIKYENIYGNNRIKIVKKQKKIITASHNSIQNVAKISRISNCFYLNKIKLEFLQIFYFILVLSLLYGCTIYTKNNRINNIFKFGHINDIKTFTRVIILYIPTQLDKDITNDPFIKELRWFIASWRYMLQHQNSKWRTDILIRTEYYLEEIFQSLSCSVNKRLNFTEESKCIVVDKYKPFSSINKNFHNYKYANSIAAVILNNSEIYPYDWILRTDIDTFLTPRFSNWKPDNLIVGSGAYCFPGQTTCERLYNISKKLNLTYLNIENVGSTWYGPNKLVQKCANLSIEIMKYLDKYEFTEIEKKEWLSAKQWPSWHYGVLTMYAGQIAINHCVNNNKIEKNSQMLDFPTTSSESIYDHAHLHTWQNYDMFSKYNFFDGKYDNKTLDKLNLSIIKDYALFLALSSKGEK